MNDIINNMISSSDLNVYARSRYSFHKSQMDLPVRFLVTLISYSPTIFRSDEYRSRYLVKDAPYTVYCGHY